MLALVAAWCSRFVTSASMGENDLKYGGSSGVRGCHPAPLAGVRTTQRQENDERDRAQGGAAVHRVRHRADPGGADARASPTSPATACAVGRTGTYGFEPCSTRSTGTRGCCSALRRVPGQGSRAGAMLWQRDAALSTPTWTIMSSAPASGGSGWTDRRSHGSRDTGWENDETEQILRSSPRTSAPRWARWSGGEGRPAVRPRAQDLQDLRRRSPRVSRFTSHRGHAVVPDRESNPDEG